MPLTPNTPAGPRQAAFIFIFITVVLDMMAVGIIIPVLQPLLVQFRGGDVASATQYYGLFAALWALMQFLFSPLVGALSDRFGRRPVILLSNLGLGLDYILMAVAPGLGWLLVGRLLSGITSASYATAGAYIADVTPAEQRAARFGMLGAAFGIGFVIGPAVGGILGNIDLRLPFWAAAALSLANFAYGYFILPESLPKDLRRPFELRSANVLGSLRWLASRPALARLMLAVALISLAHEALPNLFVPFTQVRFDWGPFGAGMALAVVGVASGVVSMAVVRPAVRRLGERRATLAGLVAGMLGCVALALSTTAAGFVLSIALIALWGIAGAALQSMLSQKADPTEQGQMQGTLGSLRALTGVIGPLLFTQVFASVQHQPEPWLQGMPYLISAMLLLLAASLALRQPGR
ncbi:MAG: hypothetical protein RL026_2649 [Pseudomonadota bacterium]|jgi:DHA1 family tetracycline resistance protein-like MFS transporter